MGDNENTFGWVEFHSVFVEVVEIGRQMLDVVVNMRRFYEYLVCVCFHCMPWLFGKHAIDQRLLNGNVVYSSNGNLVYFAWPIVS